MESSARDRSQALLAAQKESLELVVTGAPLRQVLERLVRTVDALGDGRVVAAIMLLDAEGRLRDGAAPGLPEHYRRAVDGLPAAAGVGTCCYAAARRAVVVTPSFAASPAWAGLGHLPIALGLHGAWSMPIVGRDGGVLGTFGTYFRTCREPSDDERAVVEVLARTAAIAIERDCRDETQRATLEALRVAKHAAEVAALTKGRFLATMSHELRTPLSGIVGYADLLAAEIAGPMNTEQAAHVRRIKRAAWHLVSVIDEILAYSRLEAGREVAHLAPVDLAALARECVELLVPQAAAKGLDLRLRAAEAELVIETDAGKVRQILLNLVGNALKFTDGGHVELTVRRRGRERVSVHVQDTGCGIPAAKHEQIFEPFAQVDQSYTRIAGGTGLGLTVSRELARMIGGDLRLDASRPGDGSTFVLDLPRARPPVVAGPSPTPARLGVAAQV